MPAAMSPAAQRFRALLDAERTAARDADVQAVLALQETKRDALRALAADEAVTAEERDALARSARENLALLRQLQRLYEGALGLTPATYGSAGQRRSVASTRSWGAR